MGEAWCGVLRRTARPYGGKPTSEVLSLSQECFFVRRDVRMKGEGGTSCNDAQGEVHIKASLSRQVGKYGRTALGINEL